MPDEDGFRVELIFRRQALVDAYELISPFEVGVLRRQSSRGLGLDADQRDLLEVRPAIARRFQASQCKLRGDVLGGELVAARARAATFEHVARQKLHMRANAVSRNVLPSKRVQGI